MKLARGAGNVEIVDVPEPVCGEDEVKIGVEFTGVCGTDIHVYKDEFPTNPPVIIGHEFSGTVVEVGRRVTGFKPGDPVVAENVCVNCGGGCYMCRTGHYAICVNRGAQGLNVDGAFAPYIVCDERNVYPIPAGVGFQEAALAEPMVCSVHAVLDQTRVGAGEVVLVTGPGAMGLICAQAAKAEGATVVVTGVTEDAPRLELARELGADFAVDIQRQDLTGIVMELTSGRGVDAVIECAGVEAAFLQAVALLRKRGRLTQVGLFGKKPSVDLDSVVMKEIVIRGSISHTRNAWERGLKLVAEGRIRLGPLVSAVLPLSDWREAFQRFGRREGIKILLRPI